MQRGYGEWFSRQARLLARWRWLAEIVAELARALDGRVEVYVFGSVVEGRVTGASDVDVLVLTSRDPRRLYMELSLKLAEVLGEDAAIVDLHVASLNSKGEPPVKWWLARAVRIA